MNLKDSIFKAGGYERNCLQCGKLNPTIKSVFCSRECAKQSRDELAKKERYYLRDESF